LLWFEGFLRVIWDSSVTVLVAVMMAVLLAVKVATPEHPFWGSGHCVTDLMSASAFPGRSRMCCCSTRTVADATYSQRTTSLLMWVWASIIFRPAVCWRPGRIPNLLLCPIKSRKVCARLSAASIPLVMIRSDSYLLTTQAARKFSCMVWQNRLNCQFVHQLELAIANLHRNTA
jgi:hypothetical protein